jgi:polyvinyl alcohol dehydrogenase (cytochrome)
MSMTLRVKALLLLGSALGLSAAPDGSDLYAKNCAICHEAISPPNQNHTVLGAMGAEHIVYALTSGPMRVQGARLSMSDRAAIAEYLSGKAVDSRKAAAAGLCQGAPPASFSGPEWNGWGVDLENSRFQPAGAAGLPADQVSILKLKWAFAFPAAIGAYSQPVVAGGRVFLGSASGAVYSLDAATGCTYWTFEAPAGVRSAITIGPGGIAYFGDLHATVYALDAGTGKLIWKTLVEEHPYARVTGAPKLYEGRLYVPVASRDEWMSMDPRFECCKFRGSVVALDAKTGKQVWKSYTIPEPAKPTGKSKNGIAMWGPSGVGVWSSPTIDPKRKLLYVGTGDAYSDPAPATSDSILALDLATGKIVWTRQITEGDAFNGNCITAKPLTCPGKMGPDSDFGSSPILRTLPSGRSLLLAGQKSGVLHALDPDKGGEIVWQTRVGKGGMLGGIQWGPAADAEVVYAALSDITLLPGEGGLKPDPKTGGGLFAIQIATGEKLWGVLPPPDDCKTQPCSPAQSAAVTVIPGAVFSGSLDGHLRAYSTKDGKILWDYDTAREYEAVNKVPAHGGAIDGAGPAIAGGMVFVNSGYGYFNAMPGNVLLAFGVE